MITENIALVMSLHLAALMAELETEHPGLTAKVVSRRDASMAAAVRNPAAVLQALASIEEAVD